MLGVVHGVIAGIRNSRSESTRVQTRKYNYRIRNRIGKFASANERQADLIQSFPAAAVAIVSRPEDDPIRIEAIGLVREGEPLAHIAKSLELPLWLRRLPPEAFAGPLDHRFSHHWFKGPFGALILNTAPPEAERTGRWFQAVVEAEVVGGPAFAAWIASMRLFSSRRPPPVRMLPLALLAWYSSQSGLPAGQIVHSPWNEKMSCGRAAALTCEWGIRALLDFCLDPGMLDEIWCRPRQVGGIEVVPLLTASGLCDEAIGLHNCLRRYVSDVAQGSSHIYSLRRNGMRIAAMNVQRSQATGLPRITQICGPANTRAPQDSVDAASQWLMMQLRDAGSTPALPLPRFSDDLFLHRIWGPYAQARRADIGERFDLSPPKVETLLKHLSALAPLDRF